MTTIRHIVFDIGKVLIHYDPELPFRSLIPDADERRFFLENVCNPAWNLEQDRGRGWAQAEAVLIERHPGHESHIRAFRRQWGEMVPHALTGTVAVLDALLDDGRDVTMLTNFAADTFAEATARFPFLARTRGVTVSGAIGLVKPERAIYEHHAAAFGLDPGATLFIDDSPANVEGARDAGWQAVHFRDADTLRIDLLRLGLGSPRPEGVLRRYHDALEVRDFGLIEGMMAPDAVYVSAGTGGQVDGRDAILNAFRTYFARFTDQVSRDISVERLSPVSARAQWTLTATDGTSGETVERRGVETLTLDDLGRIARVEVEG